MIYLIIFFNLFFFNIYSSDREIKLLISDSNSIYIKGILGFQSVFRRNVDLKYLQDFQSEIEIQKFFTEMENKQDEFIVVFGYEAAKLASKNLINVPIVFSFLTNSRELFSIKKNLCGIEMKPSPSEVLKVLKAINPDYKNIISFYSNPLTKFSIQEYEYQDLLNNLYIEKYDIDNHEVMKDILEKKSNDFDAILILPDPLMDYKGFNYLSEFSILKKKVFISPFSSLVDFGSTFTLAIDPIYLGEELGKFSNQILDNEIKCNTGPVRYPENQFLYINQEYSKKSDILIPEKLLKRQEADKLTILGSELYFRKMYNSAKNIFENIKNKYPENRFYKEYLNNLDLILSKEKLKNLFSKVEEYSKKKDYKKSYEILNQISKIFPNSLEVSELYNNIIQKESEEKRLEALKLISNNKNFEGIKKLNEALKIYPKNFKAKSDLENIKINEKKKYNEYFLEASGYYNKRDYETALKIFENLTLLEPTDSKLIDYIRLSKIKYDSLIKLQKCKTDPDDSCGPLK